ncbi:MAG: hypothetical protein OCD01_04465 [Fibrobacterales bacterium]
MKYTIITIIVSLLSMGCDKNINSEELDTSSSHEATTEVYLSGDTGTVTDERDGIRYPWVRIGEQRWMAENLAFKTPDDTTENQVVCFDLDKEVCASFGRVYSYHTAMDLDSSAYKRKAIEDPYDHQGICPDGWRIPARSDWTILAETILDRYPDSTEIAKHIKYTVGWNFEKGEDSFNFAALPEIWQIQSREKGYTSWWVADNTWDLASYRTYISDNDQKLEVRSGNKGYISHIRCIHGTPVDTVLSSIITDIDETLSSDTPEGDDQSSVDLSSEQPPLSNDVTASSSSNEIPEESLDDTSSSENEETDRSSSSSAPFDEVYKVKTYPKDIGHIPQLEKPKWPDYSDICPDKSFNLYDDGTYSIIRSSLQGPHSLGERLWITDKIINAEGLVIETRSFEHVFETSTTTFQHYYTYEYNGDGLLNRKETYSDPCGGDTLNFWDEYDYNTSGQMIEKRYCMIPWDPNSIYYDHTNNTMGKYLLDSTGIEKQCKYVTRNDDSLIVAELISVACDIDNPDYEYRYHYTADNKVSHKTGESQYWEKFIAEIYEYNGTNRVLRNSFDDDLLWKGQAQYNYDDDGRLTHVIEFMTSPGSEGKVYVLFTYDYFGDVPAHFGTFPNEGDFLDR